MQAGDREGRTGHPTEERGSGLTFARVCARRDRKQQQKTWILMAPSGHNRDTDARSHASRELIRQHEALHAWLSKVALPFWSTVGFDGEAGLFEEKVGLDLLPIRSAPRRVMVQARQISVFGLATERGWFDGAEIALAAGRTMIERYLSADGEPGWVFSIDARNQVHDRRRDLYAHAFVLFALAHLIRLSPERGFREALDKTLGFLDAAFADPNQGGFWDCLPRQDVYRRQNPHMHLLEAYLALAEVVDRDAQLARAKPLVDLAYRAFMDRARGTIREVFDEMWRVHPAPGQGSVEPGHQFEWAWLLRVHEELSGSNHAEVVGRLVGNALATGLDAPKGRIVDETGEDGLVRRRSSRSWPHLEALKSLSVETQAGSDYRLEIGNLLARVRHVYCKPELNGGWVDHVDERDEPLSAFVPASTLYHVSYAVGEVERLAQSLAADA